MGKGTWAINGTGSSGLLLSAIDAVLTPSIAVARFRIKLWDKLQSDTVAYDNQVACTNHADTADLCPAMGSGSSILPSIPISLRSRLMGWGRVISIGVETMHAVHPVFRVFVLLSLLLSTALAHA